MGKFKANLIYIIKRNTKLKDTLKLMLMTVQFPIVIGVYLILKVKRDVPKEIWLIGEMGIDAKDNGLAFFKYLNAEHPEINSVYYIAGDSAAADKVRKIGKTVQTGSFAHKLAFMSARYVLSTHDGYPIPFKGVNWREYKKVCGWLTPNKKYVFLNHGVNKDDYGASVYYGRTKFDYFVTTTKPEYEEMTRPKYGYPSGNIVRTGLSRYDLLQKNVDIVPKERRILYMPTWRYYLADVSDDEFVQSTYFKGINDFLHNPRLNKLLEDEGVTFYFFPPHHEIQKRIPLFKLDNTNIKTLDTEKVNFAEALLKSSMMITDFSSVIFDFAYLRRRTAYYQFDLKEYRSGQYKEGYFSYERDGFGPIYSDPEKLIEDIQRAINSDFDVEGKYLTRINRTFPNHDSKNCERLYKVLI
ncbi:glycosyl/glycerophosphate transferase [Limosilactobacillus fermentum]